jgi:hypothetical protein
MVAESRRTFSTVEMMRRTKTRINTEVFFCSFGASVAKNINDLIQYQMITSDCTDNI